MSKIPESVVHKELDLIQGCISRMAHDGFVVKGWAILLISSAFALLGQKMLNLAYGAVVCVSLFALWIMNTYFLCNERKYRILYSWVIRERKAGNDNLLYELDTSKNKEIKCSFWGTMFSPVLPYFYLLLIAITVLLSAISATTCEATDNANSKCNLTTKSHGM